MPQQPTTASKAAKKGGATYDASQITRLDFPEAIQKRPGMYIGGRSNIGHLLAEVIDNSIDEAMAGYCAKIDVVLAADGSATVIDAGRGVPVAVHPDSGTSALEMAFTQLHTGGKFNTDSYSTSGGLHGVGIKATNALSEWLEVTVRRDGVVYRQRYAHGHVETPVQILSPKTGEIVGEVGQRGDKAAIKKHALSGKAKAVTGTKISFKPSSEFMEVTRFEFSSVAHRLEVASYLMPGLQLTIVDKRGSEEVRRSYRQTGGLSAYVDHLNEGRKVIHADPIIIQGTTDGGAKVELAFQYHNDDDEEVLSFVNTIPTREGGTHVSGFRAALTKAVNVFGHEKKLLKSKGKSEDTVTGRDTTACLTVALSVLMPDPEFTSQTKTQLGTREVHGQVMSLAYDAILERFRADAALGKKIVERCLAASRAREAAAKARSLVMRKSVLDVIDTGLPGKLADVSKKAETANTVLYLVEGDSAGGSCKQARNSSYHAILPLRGKILNTERARLNRALSNAEIKSIVSAVGAGISRDFQAEDMRYGGVAILVDADVDGLHIMTLLLTLFWRFMRPMIDEGRLFIARAPLYQLKSARRTAYVYSDWERDQILSKWGKRGVSIQRYKGLGEMNPAQLKETVFAVPEAGGKPTPFANRNLYQVTVEDAHRANAMVELWMGAKVGPRKARLMRIWDGEASFDELEADAMDLVDDDATEEEDTSTQAAANGKAKSSQPDPQLALAGLDD